MCRAAAGTVADSHLVVALLESDALFATNPDRTHDHAVRCILLDADGLQVAAAHDRAGSGRLAARALTLLGRSSRAEWDVVDDRGNRVLDVVKPKQRMRGPSVEVALADGTPVGRSAPDGFGGIPPVSLLGGDDRSVGRLTPAVGERRSQPVLFYRVHGADDVQVGEIAYRTRDGWGFHLAFEPAAPPPVRALTIAHTLCLLQERMTTGST